MPGAPPPFVLEQKEQAVVPDMDGGPAPTAEVIDLSDVRAEANKAPSKGKRAPSSKGAPPTPTKTDTPAQPPEPVQPCDTTCTEKESSLTGAGQKYLLEMVDSVSLCKLSK